MMNRKKFLRDLKTADPRKYAELCEEAGYKEKALNYYCASGDLEDLSHAAVLAIELKEKTRARNLINKTKKVSEEQLEISTSKEKSLEGRNKSVYYIDARQEHEHRMKLLSILELELN